MSKNKMINKVSDNMTDKMGNLIGHDCQWTSKSHKDMFIQKLGSYCNMLVWNAHASTPFIT